MLTFEIMLAAYLEDEPKLRFDRYTALFSARHLANVHQNAISCVGELLRDHRPIASHPSQMASFEC